MAWQIPDGPTRAGTIADLYPSAASPGPSYSAAKYAAAPAEWAKNLGLLPTLSRGRPICDAPHPGYFDLDQTPATHA